MFQWLVATYDFLLKLLRNFQERKLRKEKLKQEVEATKQKKIDTKILSEKLLREQYKTFYVKEIYDTVKKQKYNEFKKIKKTMDLKKELEILIENVNGIEMRLLIVKENNIYELKNEIIVNFSELLLKEVALTYLDLLRKYQKGDAHHLILEFLNVSVLLLDKVIVDEKLWDKTDTSLLLDLKNSIFLAEKSKEKRLTKALETTKKAYKYLFIKLNFLFSLIKDKDMQEKLFLDIYNIYVKGFENKQIIFSDVINDYSKKLNRKRKFLTFNIDELNYF